MILVVGPTRILVRWKRAGFFGQSGSLQLAHWQPLCTSTVAFVWKGQPEDGASTSRMLT